ncbi:MAG: aminotransferase class I/II-fold pyridoxal phosphate-dependent enzyme [Proteobacteria bacterium]|nr:aminotransferase class I/II-fold pyridoxal phosphate-dependent enzyme [Pseudomonadota bacterium]
MEGSAILAIAGQVKARIASGADVANFTVGDFKPGVFAIPEAFSKYIGEELEAGQTNYPPAIGVPELREAIRNLYERELGLKYPEGTVQVGSGARPPIYSAFRILVEPGDLVVYSVPSWNNNYYAYLNQARSEVITASPEDGFMPTAEALAPYLREARVLCLNSPLNPTGTTISKEVLSDLCVAIINENKRRTAVGHRPLILLYDQVYWQLTFGEHKHWTPVELHPEMARYTVFIDAISKCWAGTGMRVGWGVVPPWIRGRMKPLVGHMGAWAARPEQLATARLLNEPETIAPWMDEFKGAVQERLTTLRDGLWAMRDEGMPVDALDAEGAIYLSARFDLLGKTAPDGRTLTSDEDVRRMLLEEADIAVVPFTAFGYPPKSGWVRFSIGAVTVEDVQNSLVRLRALLEKVA